MCTLRRPRSRRPTDCSCSLFDVTDAAHPKLLDQQMLHGAYAVGPNNPHAVTPISALTRQLRCACRRPADCSDVRVAGATLAITTAPFTTPYSVQTGRTVFAGNHVFELVRSGCHRAPICRP